MQNRSELRALYERKARPPDPPDPLTVEGLVIAFMSNRQRDICAKELVNIRHACTGLMLIYGDCPASDIGPVKLTAVREWMIDQDLCRQVINDRIRRIRTVYRWAMELGWIGREVIAGLGIKGLKYGMARESDRRRPVPLDCIIRTLRDKYLRDEVKSMVKIQLRGGMRPGEVCAMRGEDIDTDSSVWVYSPPKHKTVHKGKDRAILLGPRAHLILLPWLRDGHLFRTKHGNPYTTNTYYHALKRASERMGVPHWFPQQVRMRALTDADELADIETAQEIADHAQVQTTERYIGRSKRRARQYVALHG